MRGFELGIVMPLMQFGPDRMTARWAEIRAMAPRATGGRRARTNNTRSRSEKRPTGEGARDYVVAGSPDTPGANVRRPASRAAAAWRSS